MEDSVLRSRLERIAAGLRPVQPESGLATAAGRLLRACAHLEPQPAELASLVAAVPTGGWAYLVTLAEAHGMEPLVYTRLIDSGLLGAVPDAARSRLTECYQRCVVNALLVQSCLREILAAASAAECDVIPLKGTVLALRCYGSVTLRPTRDVDLLVSRADAPRLDVTLQRLGYVPARDKGRVGHFAALATAEVKYTAPRKPMIEMHWGLSKRPSYRACLPAAGVMSRAVPMTFGETTVRALDTEDELAFLCVHCVADHDEARLIWLADLARIVARAPDAWDWPRFVGWITDRGLATPVALALGESVLCLDAPVPTTAIETLLRAAESAVEVDRWRSAWESMLSTRGMITHLRELRGTGDRARFILGAAPRTLRAHLRARYSRRPDVMRDG